MAATDRTTSAGTTSAGTTSAGEFLPGFALHPIRRRAALATGTKWRDALVSRVDADGSIELIDLDNDRVIPVWNYLDLTASLKAGEPVALHSQYSVLAVGDLLLSVRGLA